MISHFNKDIFFWFEVHVFFNKLSCSGIKKPKKRAIKRNVLKIPYF